MKLVYPIILYPSGTPDGCTVTAPDMLGLVTEGNNLAEVLTMAQDAASGWVLTELEAGRPAPKATDVHNVMPEESDGIVTLITLDMDDYAARYGSRAVRKNVTIPAWLDTYAEQHHINYSQVLRDGLETNYRRELQNA